MRLKALRVLAVGLLDDAQRFGDVGAVANVNADVAGTPMAFAGQVDTNAVRVDDFREG